MDFGDGNKIGEFCRGSAINRKLIKNGEKEHQIIRDEPNNFDEASAEGIESNRHTIQLFHGFILDRYSVNGCQITFQMNDR
jgi:hypothetical protein